MTNPFSKTTLWVVISIAIVSLIVTGRAHGDRRRSDRRITRPAPTATSTSAIGHRALVELLEKLGRAGGREPQRIRRRRRSRAC